MKQLIAGLVRGQIEPLDLALLLLVLLGLGFGGMGNSAIFLLANRGRRNSGACSAPDEFLIRNIVRLARSLRADVSVRLRYV